MSKQNAPTKKLLVAAVKKASITVSWQESGHDQPIVTIDPHDRPLPEFDAAMEALLPVANDLFGFAAKWLQDRKVRVYKVAFKLDDGGGVAAKIYFRAVLKGAVEWTGATPLLRIDQPEGAKEMGTPISPEGVAAVKALAHEAIRYAEGHRSQQTFLDLLDPDPAGEDENPDLGI